MQLHIIIHEFLFRWLMDTIDGTELVGPRPVLRHVNILKIFLLRCEFLFPPLLVRLQVPVSSSVCRGELGRGGAWRWRRKGISLIMFRLMNWEKNLVVNREKWRCYQGENSTGTIYLSDGISQQWRQLKANWMHKDEKKLKDAGSKKRNPEITFLMLAVILSVTRSSILLRVVT